MPEASNTSTLACSPDKAAIEQGQSVVVRAWAYPVRGRKFTYVWTPNAGAAHGVTQKATWDLSKGEPGVYRVNVRVDDSSVP